MPPLRTRDTHPAAARSLEVSTAPPPPSLTIISPTPRSFTFPIAHNLSDSPYSSPSNSPFEPDLRVLALSADSTTSTPTSSVSSFNSACRTPPPPLPLSAFTRTLTPVVASPTTPPPAPVRRKSTSSSPEERRPKKGDEDYVKRPENAFILFRRKCCEERALSISSSSSAPSSMASGPSSADSPSLAINAKKQRQADLSKTISQQWKALSPEERATWEALAKEKKREHEALHPNYVYRPQRSSAKNRVRDKEAKETAAVAASSSSPSPSTSRRKLSAPQQVEFVVPAPRAPHGRSSSAPTPPPYQAIQIPNVYFGAASPGSFSSDGTPDSPTSLMPMISRRGSQNTGFDYMPSFAGAFEFEASLQSSDFLRAMFPPTVSPTSLAPAAIISPASSTSGSGPSSPYTPATTSFHPSAFSFATPSPIDPSTSAYPASDDMSLGIAPGSDADYASYASAWAASSPWAAAPSSGAAASLGEGDFDIARIPEIGWDIGCAAFPAAQPAFPGAEFLTDDLGFSATEGGETITDKMMTADAPTPQADGSELDLHFGLDLSGGIGLGVGGDMDMGFDEMMAGHGF